MFKNLLFASLLITVSAQAAPNRRAAKFPPAFPACTMITGTPAITFTRDHGATLAPIAEKLSGIGYTYGLAVLDTPSTLLAWHRSNLMISTNDGCSWRVVATFDDYDFPPRIVAAKGGRAYAWSDNRTFLVRYDSRGAVKVKQPAAFLGFGVNAANADHIRAGGTDGAIYDSTDAGETWTRVGSIASSLLYRFAFDPTDLDHIVAGTAMTGAFYTYDGGRNWRQSIDRANVFEAVISPADGNVVWAEGLSNADSLRHIYRSVDGGATFTAVIDQTADVHLINGTLLAPHPSNRDMLYFVFGTYFQGYGTDLYRYDASTKVLYQTHNDYNDINSIAFSPASPHLMYLGLESETGGR